MPSHSLDLCISGNAYAFTLVDYFAKTVRTLRYSFLTKRVMYNASNCHMPNYKPPFNH